MNKYPPLFMNPKAQTMKPGTVSFIPGWIMLLILILTIGLLYPSPFDSNNNLIISPLLLAFIVGSLMPAFDDLLTFLFGPPFAHHSLFHSIFGSVITFNLFILISDYSAAQFAFLGNLTHIIFNFSLDYVTPFFPITYREFGLANIIHLNTYWIKAILYPLILVLFAYSVTIYLR